MQCVDTQLSNLKWYNLQPISRLQPQPQLQPQLQPQPQPQPQPVHLRKLKSFIAFV